MPYNLTTIDLVKQFAGVRNDEISDTDINQAIADNSDEIYDLYGRPITKVETYISSGSSTYVLDEYKRKIFAVENVEIDGAAITVGAGETNYISDLNNGAITIGGSLVTGSDGGRMTIEYTPYIFHKYATYRAAEQVLDQLYVFSGEETTNTRLQFIRMKIETIGSTLSKGGEGLLRSSSYEQYDPRRGRAVEQNFWNTY